MENLYPVLADHIAASEVITPEREDILIYNTETGAKIHPNKATFHFLTLATGARSTRAIVEELSRQSGEPTDTIWPSLTTLLTRMVREGLLHLLESPRSTPRRSPPSLHLVKRLENVSLEITRTCNLSCRHCYSDSGADLPDELTREEVKTLLDQLADMACLSVTFTGGEALLHPHLFELMEYARKKPMTVLLFTNGTLLTPAVVQKLKEIGVYRVNVSVDGSDAETHDAFRGVKGAFKKTMEGIDLLREAGIPVNASVSITTSNYRNLEAILQLLREKGFHSYKLWPISFSGRAEEGGFFVSKEEFREAMEAAHAFEKKEGKGKEFYYSKTVKNCGIGSSALAVKCNGVIIACPAFDDSMALGNVRTHSIREIWNNSPLLNTLREMSVFECRPCSTCTFAAMCKGGCIAELYRRTKTLTCYDEYMCVAFEVTKDDIQPVEVDESVSNSLSVEIA